MCNKLGAKTGEINQNVTLTEILAISFTIPFRYVLIALKLDKNKKFTEEEIERIAHICVDAFK